MERVVLHCDMDNYFASVEEKHNPALRDVPFAVCGDPEMRHSIVMARNAAAKKAGVVAGISFAQAKQICPNLEYVKADLAKYLAETKCAREVYRKYSDNIIPYGLDESWAILEDGASMDEARQIADLIRLEIMYSLGLSASVGVSFNLVFSKLGSDLNKPNGTTVITRDNYKQLVWPLSADELLFVGAARKKVLANAGINTIGGIAAAPPEKLAKLLGKVGRDLWSFANGDDAGFDPVVDEIGSIGNTITPPEDLRCDDDASAVLYLLASAVCARLKKHGLQAKCVSVCTRDSDFNKTIRQCALGHLTDNAGEIFNCAFGLFKRHYNWERPLRSIGVRVDNLDERRQMSLFDDDCGNGPQAEISQRVKDLTKKFGALNFEKSAKAWEE
jgi:Nucleotidyltransferase/DNA polymerase involved in DNA repair